MSHIYNTHTATSHSELIGLTVVVISTDERFPVPSPAAIRMAAEANCFSPDHDIGLKASTKKNAIAFWAGSHEELAGVRRMYKFKPKYATQMEVGCLGDFESDILGGPGCHSIAKRIDEQSGLVTLFHCPSQGLTPVAASNLGKLRQLAQQNGCHLVVFVVATEAPFNPASLRGMVDRTLVLKPCEPDPAHEWAVSAEHVTQGLFNAKRPKALWQVVPNTKGFPELVVEPFIHEELETRVKWHMRKHGALNKDIAKAFDTSDSTITRILQGLPKIAKSWKGEDEVKEMLEYVLGQDKMPGKAKLQSSQWDDSEFKVDECAFDSEDEDDDDDEEDLDVPKRTPKHAKRW